MKNISLIIGLCAAAGFAFADIQPIVGTNVIGFAGVAVPGNANTIVTVPFEACLGSGAGMLSDLVATNGLIGTSDPSTADKLVVLTTNNTDLVYYYYWLQNGQGWTAVTTEVLLPTGTNGVVNPPDATNFPVARGLGFWVKRPASASATTVYVKGQVSSNKQATEIRAGLNLIGYGSVQSFTLNQSGIDWTGAYGTNTVHSDKIWLVNTDGSFTEYFYFVKPSTWPSSYDVCNNKWITQNYVVASNTISAGQGFWYQRRGAGSFTFKPDGE